MTNKLYNITLNDLSKWYVVATDPTRACDHLMENLTKRGYIIDGSLELKIIALEAEEVNYPDCGTQLYIVGD